MLALCTVLARFTLLAVVGAGAGVASAVGGVEAAAAAEEARRSQLQSRCSCAPCPGLVAAMLGHAFTSTSHGAPRPSSTKS